MKKRLFLSAAVFLVLNICYGALTIDNHYKVKPEIVGLIPAEQTAIDELTVHMKKIFGAPAAEGNKYIILRYDKKLGKEEFFLAGDKSGNVIITGGRPRGVLYGAYYFLDRKLGVKWLTPDVEYVPAAKSIKIDRPDYHGKPAFSARILSAEQHGKYSENGTRWLARNLANCSWGNVFTVYEKYGDERIFSPPAKCHGLFQIVTPAKYFKSNPEFWALQNGKRTHRDKRGLTADYCLTNEKLAKVTADECRALLRKNPEVLYISIQEGDHTRGYCDCEPCRKLVRECGNRESARWVLFANRVAKALKNEFPRVKFLIFAYDASRQPPGNIKAEDNVAVQICAWQNRRGLPYAHPKNILGNELISHIKAWKKVCRNILFWDYTYTFGDRMIQSPDMLLNIDNFRTFHELGIDGIYPENGCPQDNSFGIPFKPWFLARILWNPYECGNGEEDEKVFCEKYYGKGGRYVAEYYKLLRDTNRKQQFMNFHSGGSIGNPDFESAPVTVKAFQLLQKAKTADPDPVIRHRLRLLTIPVKYQMLRDYGNISNIYDLKMTPEELLKDISADVAADKVTHWKIKKEFTERLKILPRLARIKAQASSVNGSNFPAKAYDGDIKNVWHSGMSQGWCQIEFDEPKTIERIT
ncbi:MAG: DUF4838 domain-containing protein, partial [Lentisphaeria bacterium]|nr:DUF4838 domain-containing protein [Lentisphaeria bacterium]